MMPQKARNNGLMAVAGSIVMVLAGIGLAVIVGLSDWLGIVIAAFVFGVTIGSVGVLRRQRR